MTNIVPNVCFSGGPFETISANGSTDISTNISLLLSDVSGTT